MLGSSHNRRLHDPADWAPSAEQLPRDASQIAVPSRPSVDLAQIKIKRAAARPGADGAVALASGLQRVRAALTRSTLTAHLTL